MDNLHRDKKLYNEIIDLKNNTSYTSSMWKPLKQWKNKNNHPTQTPPYTKGINFKECAKENFCQVHHESHSENTFKEFSSVLSVLISPP